MRYIPSNEELLKAATGYAKLGWKIFPVASPAPGVGCTCYRGSKCPDPGKHPLLKGWQDKATSDVREVERWWKGKYRGANIGLLCGAESGVMVIDVDDMEGEYLLVEKGYNSAAPVQETGGGGWHYFFKHPGYRIKNKVKPVDGLDIRGDSGFVVLAPSLHHSGKQYQWDYYPENGFPQAPEWLLSLLQPKAVQEAVQPELSFEAAQQPANSSRLARWAQTALERETDKLARLAEGSRASTLNAVSYRMGRIMAAGLLNEAEVEQRIHEACKANGLIAEDGLQEFKRIYYAGFQAGMDAGPPELPATAANKANSHPRDDDPTQAEAFMELAGAILTRSWRPTTRMVVLTLEYLLATGQEVPDSARAIAAKLNISPGTANAAVKQLELAGLLDRYTNRQLHDKNRMPVDMSKLDQRRDPAELGLHWESSTQMIYPGLDPHSLPDELPDTKHHTTAREKQADTRAELQQLREVKDLLAQLVCPCCQKLGHLEPICTACGTTFTDEEIDRLGATLGGGS